MSETSTLLLPSDARPAPGASPFFHCCTTPGGDAGIRVVIGVSSPALLFGLESMLRSTPSVWSTGAASSRSGLLALCGQAGPCVALVDAAFCAEDVHEFLDSLRAAAPRARVVLISDDCRPHVVRAALKGGACGYLTKTADVDEISDALVAASMGQRYLGSSMTAELAECLTLQELTSREMDVLRLLARGECNKVIARELAVTVGTIKTHVRAIMVKLGSHARTDVMLKAHRLGLVRIA